MAQEIFQKYFQKYYNLLRYFSILQKNIITKVKQ